MMKKYKLQIVNINLDFLRVHEDGLRALFSIKFATASIDDKSLFVTEMKRLVRDIQDAMSERFGTVSFGAGLQDDKELFILVGTPIEAVDSRSLVAAQEIFIITAHVFDFQDLRFFEPGRWADQCLSIDFSFKGGAATGLISDTSGNVMGISMQVDQTCNEVGILKNIDILNDILGDLDYIISDFKRGDSLIAQIHLREGSMWVVDSTITCSLIQDEEHISSYFTYVAKMFNFMRMYEALGSEGFMGIFSQHKDAETIRFRYPGGPDDNALLH